MPFPPYPVASRIKEFSRVTEAGCWEWQHYTCPAGYGRLSVNNRVVGVHRASYEAFVGPIPAGLTIDHLCRNSRCVNPAHLEPVTNAENIRRSAASKTHCPNGHPYSEENTYRYRGRRSCRTCNRLNSLKRWRRQAALRLATAATRVRPTPKRVEPVAASAKKEPTTHCAAGHLYDPANTFTTTRGYRVCRACRVQATLRWKARARARKAALRLAASINPKLEA